MISWPRKSIFIGAVLFLCGLVVTPYVVTRVRAAQGGTGVGSVDGPAVPTSYYSQPVLQKAVDAAANTNGGVNLETISGGLGGSTEVDGKTLPNSIPDNIVTWIINSISGSNTQTLATNPDGTTRVVRVYTPGAVEGMSNLTAQLMYPRISSTEYVADVMQNIRRPFGEQPAYAQGIGYSSLQPVLELWKLFRNVAYLFFVVLFLIIGFLIMVRSKIGAKAAVTVQEALPKIVVSLVLVTFSYAIAGLMIDIMYLIIYMVIGVLQGVGGVEGNAFSFANLSRIAFTDNIFGNGFRLIGDGVIGNVAKTFTQVGLNALEPTLGSGIGTDLLGKAASLIITLVLVIALLVNLFRIFFSLLRAYVGVLLSVIFAPIQLMLGALPGQNAFEAWLRGLIGNLAVFPTLIILILLAYYFSSLPDSSLASAGPAIPQVASATEKHTLMAASTGFRGLQMGISATGTQALVVKALIVFALLSLMPKAAEMAQQIAQGKFNIDPGKAMGEFWKQGQIGQTVGMAGAATAAGLGLGAVGGAAVGGFNAVVRHQGRQAFNRDLRRGLAVGGGGGFLVGGGLPLANRALKTVGGIQRNIKSVSELSVGARDAATQGRAQSNLSAAQVTPTSTPTGGSPTAGIESSEN